MAARKESAGITCWYSNTGTSWSQDNDVGTGINLWRVGSPDAIQALAGMAVRGWRIAGSIPAPPPIRASIELSALQGCAYPQPNIVRGVGGNGAFVIERADTSCPIGAIPRAGNFAVVGSPEWVGLFTHDWVRRRESDAIPYVLMSEFSLLVSPKATWSANSPATIEVGVVEEVKITVAYPDGEPVTGLQLELSAGGRTEVRGASGDFKPAAQAVTNAQGVATFRARGLSAGAETLRLFPNPYVALRESPYSPPLPGVVQMEVRETPGEVPGECITYPAVPAVPAVPDRIDVTPILEWNAGANSVTALDGDVRVRFDQNHAVGVVIGLANARDIDVSLEKITHGFYFHATAAGQYMVAVMEGGKVVSPVIAHDNTAEFEIQRVGGTVSYFIDDVLFYASRAASTGEVSVNTALYATGDTAP